jgi:hypothetical protein
MLPTRSVRNLGTAVMALLAVQICLFVFDGVALAMRIDLLQRIKAGAFVTSDEARASDGLVRATSLSWLLVFLVTGILWLVWQHRAQSNVRWLTAEGTSFTPGWAVGWWFVPFANLVKPFQAVSELWRASVGGTSWRDQPSSWVLGAWWFAWLAFNLSGLFGRNGDATEVDSLITEDQASLVSMGLGVVAAGLAIWVVSSIVTRQKGAIATAPGTTPPPPPLELPPAPAI